MVFRRLPATAVLFCVLSCPPCRSALVEYDLTIEDREIQLAGKPVRATTINGTVPGPVLRFTEGDTARIRVRNAMTESTSIHWHGVLVPPGMDGVPRVSFPGIPPGGTFAYEFPIRQSGTYWYHSHSGLQEQSGVYGALVIDPKESRDVADRDFVALFSDWTDEDPAEILRTLRRGDDWYALRKSSAQSVLGAARMGLLGEYFALDLLRMGAMDIADVFYDRFLVNGSPEIELFAKPGDTVRLRVIDGSATTYFHLEYAGGPMTIVAADGPAVEPVRENRFLIAVAETYDLLLPVPGEGSWEFRATAHDGSGHASVWIGSGERRPAADVPKPNLYQGMGQADLRNVFAFTPAGTMGMSDREVAKGTFDRPGMPAMDHGGHPPSEGMAGMHPGHEMHAGAADEAALFFEEESPPSTGGAAMTPDPRRFGDLEGLLAEDASSAFALAEEGGLLRPPTPYPRLRSPVSTDFPPHKPLREVRLTLDGDMERYVWAMNGKSLSADDEIPIRGGEVTRLLLINRTMMHHPMHLHGHFFRVLNGQGAHAPLKHTVDVAPMSTTVIEFDGAEPGDWLFHCHLLYHMKSGMERIVHYEGFPTDPALAKGRHGAHEELWHLWGEVGLQSQMTEGYVTLSSSSDAFLAEWEAGWGKTDHTDWEGVLTWDRWHNGFFAALAGVTAEGRGRRWEEGRAVLGLRYLLPLRLDTRMWIDSDGGGRVSAEKEIVLAPRVSAAGEAEYDTHDRWRGNAKVALRIGRRVSLLASWDSRFGFGGGFRASF